MNTVARVQKPILTDDRKIGRSPFTLMIGLKFVQCQGHTSSYAVESAPELLDVHETLHGGVIMSLLDAAMATAALSDVDFLRVVVTLSLSVSFVCLAKGKLTAIGEVVGSDGAICRCKGKVFNKEGRLIATAIASFKYQNKIVPSNDATSARSRDTTYMSS